MGRPSSADWDQAEQVSLDLLASASCSSVCLPRGCTTRGILGISRQSRAIIGNNDFARLSALRRKEMLNLSALPIVVPRLTAGGPAIRVCESEWPKLVSECVADPRYAAAVR